MRQCVGGRAITRTAASTSQMGRFETEVLSIPDNRTALMNLSGKWIDRLHQKRPMKKLVLDMDSSVSETYGSRGYRLQRTFRVHVLSSAILLQSVRDVEFALLREGNVHSAKDWRTVLEPIVARYRDRDIPHFFRGDAAFANSKIYEYLEGEHFQYVIRLPANDVLHREIEHLMTRPVGRPPKHHSPVPRVPLPSRSVES